MSMPTTAARARITSPFGYRTTAAEVAAGRDLSGLNVIVTGAASGIGVETALALAGAGAQVVMAVRDQIAAGAIAGPANSRIGAARMRVGKLDLSDRRSIASFAAAELERGEPVHVLINNAGVMACPLMHTADGFEMQFGTNHLGHFLLTAMLGPLLETAAAERGKPSRVVSLSSIGHRRSPIVWDDIQYETRAYDKWESYGQAKTANALFAVGLSARQRDHGIVANAVMPGGIMTPLQRHLPKEEMIAFGWIDENGVANERMKTPQQGAATSVWAAIGPELEGVGGLYLEDCQEALAWTKEQPWSGVMAHAIDPEAAERLWRVSEDLVGFEFT